MNNCNTIRKNTFSLNDKELRSNFHGHCFLYYDGQFFSLKLSFLHVYYKVVNLIYLPF